MKDKMEQSPAINPNPALSVEKDGTVLYSNKEGGPLLHEWGVEIGEKLPSSIGDIVRRVISRNSPEKMEVNVGKSVYLVVFHPLPDLECVNISGFDISDQKELEEKPQESEEKYQDLFNLIEQAVQIGEIVFDEKGQPIDNIILDVNLAYEKHSGLRREQVIGRGFKEILPIVEQTWLDRYGKVVRTGMGMHFEEYNASLDRWFEVFASPMGGNRFIAIFSDITKRKQTEAGLLQSEQDYRLLYETMLQGVIYQDASGKIISMNPAAERILGKTPSEFLGSSSVGEEDLTIREDGSPFPGLEHPSMVSLRTGRKVQDVVMGVYNPCEKCYRWININAVPIFRTGEDKPFQVYTLFDDITEHKQEEHRIFRYNRILKGINKIFSNVVQAKTEEELGNACLSVALEITGSQFGFVNEMGTDGLLHDVAKSELAWEQCLMYDRTGHRRPPSDFVVHGLYGSVIINEKSFFTNDPQSHPDSIGLPSGHPPLTSFLGVPLVQEGKAIGLIAVANREKGYSCEQQEDLEAIVPAVVQALQRKKAEQKRKQAEKALQMSEERYRSLYENSLDGILLTKPDGTILSANPQACQMFGMTEDEIKRVGRKDILINDEKLAAALEERELTGRMRAELIHRRKDGSTFVCDTTSKLFVDADGSISTSLIIRDISERKRAERALRESEEKYRIVADNTFDWEFWLDPDDRFLYTSPSCERITGYAAWEFIDNPDLLQEIIHPDDRQAFLQHQHDTPPDRHGDIEFRIVTKDGEIRWIHHLCQPLYDGEGGYAGSRGSNRDITERKQAEETLAFERSQLLSIFDGIDDVVYVTDPYTYEVLYANKAMKERFGGELVGGICYREFQQRDSPCDFCTNQIILKEKDKPYHWEYYNPSVDRYFIIMDRIIKWPDGRDVRFEIAKDITERRQAEEALSQERNLLESVMRTTDVMLVFLDPQFNFLWVNPAYAEACRMKPEDMVGKNHFALYPHAENEAIFRKVRDTGEGVFYKDKPFVYPDQPERGVTYWDWSLTSVKDSCGEVEGLVFSLRETTKYKQVEEALRESEERLRLLGDNLPDSALYQYIYEPDGSVRFLYISTGIERLNGVSVSDVLRDSNTLYRQVPPEYLERLIKAEARSARELSDIDMELPTHLPNGQVKWMRLHSRPRQLPDGRTIWNGVQIDITENKQAEEALKKARETLEEKVKERTAELEEAYNSLKESERGFAEAQKMAHIGNWDNDLVIGELHWSEEMYRIFGRNPKEGITYDKFLSYIHPENRDYVYDSTKEAFNGKVYATDYRIIRPDGEERIVHSEREVIFDERNNHVRMRGTVQDITEHKKSEEKIRSLANIVESSNDAIGTISLDNIITSWNEAAEQVYGYSAGEVLGKHTSILAPPHLDKETGKLSEMIKQGKKIRHHETSRLRKDGKIIHVSITLSPVFDSHGKLAAISFISRDITERRRVEEKLRDSEEKYRNIVETANEGIWILDAEARTTYINKKMTEMLGYNQEEMIGRSVLDFADEECKTNLKLSLGRRRKGINESHELKLIRKDGSTSYVLANAKSLLDKDGKFMGSMGMLTDITVRKKAEEALKNIEIARKQEIHHRIKNNLQVISSLLDLQAEKFNKREDIKDSEVLKAFRESQDRVMSIALIHEELHEGGGDNTLYFSPYLEKLIEILFQTYRLGNVDIGLSMDLEENIFFDMDTAIPLGIIVNELVSNSLKHAFPNRNKGEIQIKLFKEEKAGEERAGNESDNNEKQITGKGAKYTLIVSDDGTGIPENIDLESSDTLGLQLVNILVDQLDGEIELKRDRGAEFIIRINVQQGSEKSPADGTDSEISGTPL